MIKVENLSKYYGPVKAIDGISFEVERGEVVGFLGPNGAGKTSTMRILAGYMPPTEGKASIAGHDSFLDSLAARQQLGYLPEGVPLYPEMRVEEYLSYRARIKQVHHRERKNRLGYVLDRCGIAPVRRKLIGSLSKGYRQRVGLAEAMIHDPPVLILDEPTIGLDPNQIRQVRQLIRDLGRERTILLSTHILSEVEMVCGRVIIIRNGKLVFQDRLSNISRGTGNQSRLHVELNAAGASAETALKAIPGVQNCRWDGKQPYGRYVISVSGEQDVREDIFRCAVKNGWTIREIHSEAPSLEDIFVQLTAKD